MADGLSLPNSCVHSRNAVLDFASGMNDQSHRVVNPDYSRAVLDAVPLPIFVVDNDVRIVDCNVTAGKMLGPAPESLIRRQGGEVLHCVHSKGVGESCGCDPACKDCVVRNAVQAAHRGESTTREKVRLESVTGNEIKEVDLLVTCHPFTYEGRQLALLILEDISELVALRSLLPICAKCKKNPRRPSLLAFDGALPLHALERGL